MKKFDYDLIVVGGGAAGFVSAKIANGFGKKVAMVEKRKLGGECTWFGCIPSKTLIRVSHIAQNIRNLGDYGLKSAGDIKLDTENVMSHVRSIVQKVYNGHLPEAFEKIGIKILSGEPEFLNNHQIKIGDKTVSAEKFIIATGSSAFIPPIEGLNTIPYLINETFFDLEKLPESMIILGGGPIGIELSQAINRLGVETTVVEMMDRILFREDKELADILAEHLRAEGVKLLTKNKAVKFSKDNGKILLTIEDENKQHNNIKADAVLVAVGRKPNTDGLNLENAGIKITRRGIITDERLKTAASNIYAAGDVVGPYQFSHMAEYQAVIATINVFLPLKKKADYRNVIWCTYTDPELAHAGLTEEEAIAKYGDKVKIYYYKYNNLDRAKTDLQELGRGKFICDRKGKLIGAHILGHNAGDLIHEAQLLKSLNIKFPDIQSVIHAYPTYSDITRQAGKLAYIEKLQSNFFIKLIKTIFLNKK